MELKKPEFTPYDFLGYLMPGMATLCLCDLAMGCIQGKTLTYDFLIERYVEIEFKSVLTIILAGYFAGHIVSFLSSLCIEKHASFFHGHPGQRLLKGRPDKHPYLECKSIRSGIKRVCLFLFHIPILPFEFVVAKWFQLFDLLNPKLSDHVLEGVENAAFCFNVALGLYPDQEADDQSPLHQVSFSQPIIHYCIENVPNHVYTLRNYVVLYGFLRAMTFIAILFSWGALIHAISLPSLNSILITVSTWSLAFIVYSAYWKLWSRYFHEAYMALLVNRPCADVLRDDDE